MKGTRYELKLRFKLFFWALGILMLPVFGMGLVPILLALFARVTFHDDHLEYWWLGPKKVDWKDIVELKRASGAGPVGSAMKPHSIVRATGRPMTLPVGVFENSRELVAAIEARTGAAAR